MVGNSKHSFFFNSRGKYIAWIFDTEYDFSIYTDSEIREIKAHMSLEQFAIEQKVEEREELFRRARAYDRVVNRAVVSVDQKPGRYCKNYTRYQNLEDALRHLLWGNCMLGVNQDHHGNIFVVNDESVWCLRTVPESERIYVPKDVDVYSHAYLKQLNDNKLLEPIGKAWLYDKGKKEEFNEKVNKAIDWEEFHKRSCKSINRIKEYRFKAKENKNSETESEVGNVNK